MTDEWAGNLIPVDYDPFNPNTVAAGATAISGNDPTLGTLTTGANIQQERFGGPAATFATPQRTQEGYPYLQRTQQPAPAENPWAWRKDFLRDQRERDRLIAYMDAEVGGQGPQAAQGFAESIFNRGWLEGRPIGDVLSGGYFPQVTHWRASQPVTDEMRRKYEPLISAVENGSNITSGATGNASGTVGFAGGPQTAHLGGEKFGIEGWTLDLARELGWTDLPKTEAEQAQFARDVAAYRTRQAVRPEGGRTEGLATKLLENYLPHAVGQMASIPQRAFESAGSLQYGGSYDPEPVMAAAQMGITYGMPMARTGSVGAFGGRLVPVEGNPFAGEQIAPVFHSAVEQRIATVQVPKATGEQWLGMLRT